MVKSPHRVKLEPVGVFWDIENCPVPVDKSAFSLAAKMRRVFFEGKREAEFMCVCDVTKERKEVTDALHKAQVNCMRYTCRHSRYIQCTTTYFQTHAFQPHPYPRMRSDYAYICTLSFINF